MAYILTQCHVLHDLFAGEAKQRKNENIVVQERIWVELNENLNRRAQPFRPSNDIMIHAKGISEIRSPGIILAADAGTAEQLQSKVTDMTCWQRAGSFQKL